ncbi:MAG: hypothetical protein ABI217_00875 [Chthoniobacterales bacterium]
MPSDSSSDLKAEIGHVLFVDIVGYSKLLINEQSDLLEQTLSGADEIAICRRQVCGA